MLFGLYIAGVGDDIFSSGLGFSLGNVVVTGLLFADDVLLMASTGEGQDSTGHC